MRLRLGSRQRQGPCCSGQVRNGVNWLTGQMGLSPANRWKVVTAFVLSIATFGSELWWKGS